MRADGAHLGTVRFRVTAVATVAVVAILTVAGVLLVEAQERLLEENLRDAIEQRVADVAAGGAPLGAGRDDDIVVRAVADGTPEGWTTADSLPGLDEDALVLTRRLREMTVQVAGSLGDIEESTTTLRTSMTIGIPIAAVVLAALVWWLVGRTLRPVEAIRAEVAAIGGIAGADLDRRVVEPPGDDEIARLARTMNGMLDRVAGAVRRQQQFVADASHELRSPLARIRAELEVDEAHPDGADLAASHRSVLEETVGLERLVDDLLHLARRDAGTAAVRDDPVDLDDLVARVAGHVRDRGRLTVDVRGVTAAQVRGDAGQLARAVGNLADNAARHAATAVTFTVAERDGVAEVGVADDGAGIPAEDRERVFERFARLDDARSGATGGTGLGLAIARDIIERHGGSLVVEPADGGGARFVATLPLAGQS